MYRSTKITIGYSVALQAFHRDTTTWQTVSGDCSSFCGRDYCRLLSINEVICPQKTMNVTIVMPYEIGV